MPLDSIIVKGAREHNLKNIDVTIPRDKLVVITGVSGSGKSSLAFDTIYAEGQRRYVESLSSYARQFLGRMEKPDVDYIEGLSPAISIDQKGPSRNPRSTVGTVTEIYDYLRVLFARIGEQYCIHCGKKVGRGDAQGMVQQVTALPEGTKILIMAPLVENRKGEHRDLLDHLRLQGYARVRIDGVVQEIENVQQLAKHKKHAIEAVVDRLRNNMAELADVDEKRNPREGEVAVVTFTAFENGEGTPDSDLEAPEGLLGRKAQLEVFTKENGWPGVGNIVAPRGGQKGASGRS